VCVAVAALSLPVLAPRAFHAWSPAAAAGGPDNAVQVSAVLERRAGPAFTERPAQTIVAQAGDTVESLAAAFHADASTLRWANNLIDVSQPVVGAKLLVPPGKGALVRVTRVEHLLDFASHLSVDPRVLLDYNTLANDAPLNVGAYLQVPAAVAPPGALGSDQVMPAVDRLPAVASTEKSVGHNAFPYGQCTYYVATKRNITWSGDAWAWVENARAAGRPTGQIPVAGAIAVMWGSWVGHVAYVESVNPDGSFVVSEWNVRGWGAYDERTLSVGRSDIIGFIY
jgi:hypothetical protein